MQLEADATAPHRGEPMDEVPRPLDRVFRTTVTLKGLDGLFETLGGILLLLVAPNTLHHLARALTQHELSQDPRDFIATRVLHAGTQLTNGTRLYAAIYLLAHGLSKVVLVAAVLQRRLWAYPWMIALLVGFIAYQLYQLIIGGPTIGLTLLTIFDAFVVWLTWKEYRSNKGVR